MLRNRDWLTSRLLDLLKSWKTNALLLRLRLNALLLRKQRLKELHKS